MSFVSWRFTGDADVRRSKEILQCDEKAGLKTAAKADTKT